MVRNSEGRLLQDFAEDLERVALIRECAAINGGDKEMFHDLGGKGSY